MAEIEQFIQAIPKAELHVHIEGTLEPPLMFELARRNNMTIPYPSIEAVYKAYKFEDLQSFLDIYYQAAQVLVQEKDFYDLTWAYIKRCAEQNVRHTEIFFDPQTHTERGIAFDTVIQGIRRALEKGWEEYKVSSKLILCFLRHLSPESAMKTLEEALPYKKWIVAVGLDSSELDHPPEKFKAVFARACEEGFLTVAHAGEEGPASYIWQALKELHVSRIDHGVRCDQDPNLVEYLLQNRIPLTICPLSNVKLRVFPALTEHNLPALLNLGLCVTVNSDDPAYFGGYITENLLACQKAFDFTVNDIYTLSQNAFLASFLTAEEKNYYLQQLEAFRARQSQMGKLPQPHLPS